MQFEFFFFNDTATTEIYTLSLHDALPISRRHARARALPPGAHRRSERGDRRRAARRRSRSEEHTSELQSPCNLVCRLLLEKKKKEGGVGADVCCNVQHRHTASATGLGTHQ